MAYVEWLLCRNQESVLSSPECSIFLSPPVTLSFISNNRHSFITPQTNSARRADETLEERARRILGPCLANNENVQLMSTLQQINFASSNGDANSENDRIIQYERNKKELIDDVKSCLTTMDMARQAADHLCQLYSKIARFQSHRAVNEYYL